MQERESGEYSAKHLSTEEFGGKNLIGSLANYLIRNGLPDHKYLALLTTTFADLLSTWWDYVHVLYSPDLPPFLLGSC